MNWGSLNIQIFDNKDWKQIAPQRSLLPNELHLWRIHQLPQQGQSSLQAAKPLLDFYLGEDAVIDRNTQGKPLVYTAQRPKIESSSAENANENKALHSVQFNLSHTKDVFMIGFIRQHHIGVDVEVIKPERPWKSIAQRFYDPAEFAQINAVPEVEQEDLFYQLWTLKEAMIKCLGISIFTGLPRARFNVSAPTPSLLEPTSEDQAHQFFHAKDSHYFSIAITPLA